MKLSLHQREALVEIVNIAFGRAASSLSGLADRRVLLEVPKVSVRPIEELVEHLSGLVHWNVAAVHQEVLGALPGDALLVQTENSGILLTEMLTGAESHGSGLSLADQEVLNEIGNIVLHACIGTIANTLGLSMMLKSPQVYVEDLQQILDRISHKRTEVHWGLVISTRFRLAQGPPAQDTEVSGYILMLLSVAFLDRLLEALDALA